MHKLYQNITMKRFKKFLQNTMKAVCKSFSYKNK